MNVATPFIHGPKSTPYAAFAQPVSAVVQCRSVRWRSSQYSPVQRCAKVYACACRTAFGSFVVPDV